jgi:macrodomain Ter protein organizer (MatP/YcbG family)
MFILYSCCLATLLLQISVQRYRTANQDTGVIAYETSKNSIRIKFRDGSIYAYTNKSAGIAAISEMKTLANKGEGLTTYINQHVRDHYQSKLK